MPINDGKYVVPAWQDGGPPAIDAAELTAIGQTIVTNQNGVAQNTQNVSTLQQQMSTANQNIASLQQFQTTATSQIANLTNNYLPKSGGTMTGPITLPGNPSGALQAVPKQYADARGWTLLNTLASQVNVISGATASSNELQLGNIDNYNELKVTVEFNLTLTSGSGLDIVLTSRDDASDRFLVKNGKIALFQVYQNSNSIPWSITNKYTLFLQKSVLGHYYIGSGGGSGTNYTQPVFTTQVPAVFTRGSGAVRHAPTGLTSNCFIKLLTTQGFSSSAPTWSGTVTFTVYGR